MYAIEQLAVHDALQAVHRRSEPYVYGDMRPVPRLTLPWLRPRTTRSWT